MTILIKRLYRNRFSHSENELRTLIWKELCSSVFQKYIKKGDIVIDIGAGYCEFINNIKCGTKIAVDINPDIRKFAGSGIIIINKNILDIPRKFNNYGDVVFLSNFLEHLNSKEEVLEVLAKAYKLLKPGGKIMVMQPNIDLVKESYWDFIDHKVALNTRSIIEALKVSNFQISEFIKKFLPYTTKSGLLFPISNVLLKIYLRLPQIIRPFAGQSFAVGIKKV